MKHSMLALAFIAAFAFAQPGAAVDLSASPEEIAAEKARWIERLSQKQAELADAKARHAQAQAAYQRMRTRTTSRGEKRTRVVAELRDSEAALAEAEAQLESALAEARSEGVPPGWIRDVNSRGNAAAPAPVPND